jgi:hypothetical protein
MGKAATTKDQAHRVGSQPEKNGGSAAGEMGKGEARELTIGWPTQALQVGGSTIAFLAPSVGHISYCRVLPVIARLLVLYLCLFDCSLFILYLGGD